jgi:hypothetical protein
MEGEFCRVDNVEDDDDVGLLNVGHGYEEHDGHNDRDGGLFDAPIDISVNYFRFQSRRIPSL